MVYNTLMLLASIVTAIVAALLLLNEYLWRKHKKHNEFNRKFIHIVVGSFVAFWPYFLSWNWILGLSVIFLLAVGVSKYFNVFKAIHAVTRPSLGELFFAIAVGAVALITHDKAVYAIALLHMSLADGLAAVMGVRYGKKTRYRVLGSEKSVIGTLSFFVVSVALLSVYAIAMGASWPVEYLPVIALVATGLENVGVYGSDNLLAPVFVAVVLLRLT